MRMLTKWNKFGSDNENKPKALSSHRSKAAIEKAETYLVSLFGVSEQHRSVPAPEKRPYRTP